MNNQIDPQRNELQEIRINKKYKESPNGKLPPSEMVPDWMKEVWTRLLNFQVGLLKVTSWSVSVIEKIILIVFPRFYPISYRLITPLCMIFVIRRSQKNPCCMMKRYCVSGITKRTKNLSPFEIMAPKLPSRSYINPNL